MAANTDTPWFLKSTRPVLFPEHEALTQSGQDFDKFLDKELQNLTITAEDLDVILVDDETLPSTDDAESRNPFMDGLHKHDVNLHVLSRNAGRDMTNKTLTTNGDVANISTNDVLVDLFHELADTIDGFRLIALLDAAWAEDPVTTLKIIFNSRSIHLGKSVRKVFYRAAGWLAKNHPRTLIANLPWLCRPVIEKKKRVEAEDDMEIISVQEGEGDESRFDVQYGVSHGYWKDLLNILALAVNGKLGPLHSPAEVLNVEDAQTKRLAIRKRQRRGESKHPETRTHATHRGTTRGGRQRPLRNAALPLAEADHLTFSRRRDVREDRHKAATEAFESDPFYRALHLAIARLFAEQLRADAHALRHGDAKAKKAISICAKWAPSDDHFHERHTFIISSIAESLYPREQVAAVDSADTREVYLRHARELYRRDISALRKYLDVVEIKVTSKSYDKINYSKVPSLAMDAHKMTFIKNDTAHFAEYLKDVATGKATTSGATLLPSTIMRQVREMNTYRTGSELSEAAMRIMTPNQIVQHNVNAANVLLLDGQWKSLVERIRQSGDLNSSIAVCDVSGSMLGSRMPDGTTAMDAAIGLSMLVAEVTKPPFHGSFITFSTTPAVVKLDMAATVAEKRSAMASAHWRMTTDFVSVFRDLILPVAVKNNIAPQDMVKRVFVFSDMQFDTAQPRSESGGGGGGGRTEWQLSYEVIQDMYKQAGYDLPELVFWDLAGTAHGVAATKPVTAADVGTVLVNGYSQGMLKVFMDGGSFKDVEVNGDGAEEENDFEMMDGDGEEDVVVVKANRGSKTTPRALVERAVSHPAYSMLAVYD